MSCDLIFLLRPAVISVVEMHLFITVGLFEKGEVVSGQQQFLFEANMNYSARVKH